MYVYISGWWFGTFFIFPNIGNVIIPIDFHIFQRGSNHQPDICIDLFTNPLVMGHLYVYIYIHQGLGLMSLLLGVSHHQTKWLYFEDVYVYIYILYHIGGIMGVKTMPSTTL